MKFEIISSSSLMSLYCRVFVRCDLNVPMDKQFKITDDTRIRGAIPTLKYLIGKGAKVYL